MFDPPAMQPSIVVAGVTPFATHAAGEFLAHPLYLDDSSNKAPHNYQTKNMELLIHSDVVDGNQKLNRWMRAIPGNGDAPLGGSQPDARATAR
jgi:hypothetical protein